MSLHSFEPEIAGDVGINAAVIYQNIVFWCEKNAANGRHIHDGMAWTYNSTRVFSEMFPYLTSDQVRRAIERLVEQGYIATGNFNDTAYDRTRWFCDLRQVHLAPLPNRSGENAEPIPDSKPDHKPDHKRAREEEPSLFSEIDQPNVKAERSDRFEEFWKVYPKKAGKKKARDNFARAVKGGADPQEIIDGARHYAEACAGTEDRFIKWAQGWLTEERWTDRPEPEDAQPSGRHRFRPAPDWMEVQH